MENNQIFMVILKCIALCFIVYVSYTEGQHDAIKKVVERANKFNKVEYSLQDVEIIIFGEKQE